MQKVLTGVVVGAVVLIGGWYLVGADSREEARMTAEKTAMEEKVMMEKAEMIEKEAAMNDEKVMGDVVDIMKKEEVMEKAEMITDEAVMKKEEQAMEEEGAMIKKAGLYAPYEASKLAMAESGNVVLFFKASWCPSCRTLDSDIKANLDTIPSDLTILELDYDTSLALKQQYGVTTQHTLVQVDANGKLIKKWSGGSTVASIVEQIQ